MVGCKGVVRRSQEKPPVSSRACTESKNPRDYETYCILFRSRAPYSRLSMICLVKPRNSVARAKPWKLEKNQSKTEVA